MKVVTVDLVDFWFENDAPSEVKKSCSYFSFVQGLLYPHIMLEISRKPEVLIYSAYGQTHKSYHDCLKIFMTAENMAADFLECDYAFTFDRFITSRHIRLPNCRVDPYYPSLIGRRSTYDRIPEWKEHFCGFVVSNPAAQERIDFFHELSRYKMVLSGGKVENNLGYIIPPNSKAKIEWLGRCKFAITFENESQPGYVTEKIEQALVAGCVPIYWGDPMVHHDFNPCSFINMDDYRSMGEAVKHIAEIDQDEQLYLSYLNASPLNDGVPPQQLSDDFLSKAFLAIFANKKRHMTTWNSCKYRSQRFLTRVEKKAQKSLDRVVNKVKKFC